MYLCTILLQYNYQQFLTVQFTLSTVRFWGVATGAPAKVRTTMDESLPTFSLKYGMIEIKYDSGPLSPVSTQLLQDGPSHLSTMFESLYSRGRYLSRNLANRLLVGGSHSRRIEFEDSGFPLRFPTAPVCLESSSSEYIKNSYKLYKDNYS